MNDIIQKQNRIEFIELLKAQRIAYSECKSYLIYDIISIIIAIILPFVGLIFEDIVKPLGAFGFILTILYLISETRRKKLNTKAAKIQEQFDTDLFNLPWNYILCKTKVDQDTIHDFAEKYKKNDLQNWYSTEIDDSLPHNIAVILCQRTNFSWEISLRKLFAKYLIATIVIYYGLIGIISIIQNTGIYNLMILLVPSLSFLIYGIRNSITILTQNKAKQETLQSIDNCLENYVKNRIEPTTEILRQIQDVTYIERSSPEKIPDWFYRRFKQKNESKTDYIIRNFKIKLSCQY